MKESKVLLVTGGSSSVGIGLVSEIEKEYSTIWVHYNNSADKVNELRGRLGDKIKPVKADFSKEEDVIELINTITESKEIPDHIVHLAAIKSENKKFHKFNWDEYQDMTDSSLKPAVLILKKFLPSMSKNNYGKVVLMLSSFVGGAAPKYQSPYIVSKYALYGLMRNLAAEYIEKGITVNAVSPDMMETGFIDNIPDIIKAQNAENSPIKRNLMVEDVIPTFKYLLSDGADTVYGQNIIIMGKL